jgi:hypothetical protein
VRGGLTSCVMFDWILGMPALFTTRQFDHGQGMVAASLVLQLTEHALEHLCCVLLQCINCRATAGRQFDTCTATKPHYWPLQQVSDTSAQPACLTACSTAAALWQRCSSGW